MKDLIAALSVEGIKLRRSKIFLITIAFFIFIPLMLGLMIYIAQHPEIMERMGIVGTKASLLGENNWKGFFEMLNQSVALIGFIGFGFVTGWVFGREYIDRTIKDILVLPVTRSSIVIAKFMIILLWCALLSIIMFATGLGIGYLLNIPGWPEQLLSHYRDQYFITAFLALLSVTPVAFLASYGRGIIAPIAFAIITLIIAQFVTLTGLGPYFPWAVPGVYTAPPDMEGMQLIPASYIILALTCFLGIYSTVLWWKYADHH